MLGSWAYGAFKGKVDNLRIWKTAQSEEEISKNMKKVLVVSNPNLIRNYLFDETAGRQIVDRTSNDIFMLSTADCSMRISAADNLLYPADYIWTTQGGFLATGEEVLIPYCETQTTYTIKTQKPDGTFCSTTYLCSPKPECTDMPMSMVPSTDIIEYSGALVKLIANPNVATLPSSTYNLNESANFNEQNSRIDFGSRSYENNFTVEGWIKPELNDIDLVRNFNTPFNNYNEWNWNQIDQSYWMASNFTSEYKATPFVSVGSNGIRIFEFVINSAANWSSYRSRIEYEFPDKPKTSWAHVAVVYENKKAKLYVDGSLVKEATVISDVPVYAPSHMGDNGNRQNSFKGSTDEVRIWNTARSATQIKDNMYGTATASGVSSYYKFDSPSNNIDAFGTQNLSPQNITFTPATPATLTNTDYSKITWWRNGVQVGTGKEYVIPQSDIVAGKKLYTAKILRPDNTICETDKLVTILPQPACDVTTGCFVVTGLNTNSQTNPLVWYGPAKDDATNTSPIKSIRTSKALGFANQSWRVTCLGNQNYKIISNLDGKALELASGKVTLATNEDKDAQKWKFYVQSTLVNGNKVYRISPFNDATKALTMSVNSNDLLTLTNLIGTTGDDSQKFIFASKPCLVEGTACAATGELTYERWNFSLPTDDGYATRNNPDISTVDWTSTADIFDVITIGAEIPSSLRERPEDNYYAARLSGYICPPESAQYEFFGAADDRFELWISPDNQPDNTVKVALSTTFMTSRGYSETDQGGITKSSPIGLLKNTKYYFELRMKEVTGGDNASVAWRKVGDNTAANALTPIDPQYLSPYERCGINIKFLPKPKEGEVFMVNQTITIEATPPANSTAVTYTWKLKKGKQSDLIDDNGNYLTTFTGNIARIKPREAGEYTYQVTNPTDATCFKLVKISVKDVQCDCKYDCDGLETTNPTVTMASTGSASKNFVIENTHLEPSTVGAGAVNQMISYFDGLGRPIQKIAREAGASGEDIVTGMVYDVYGREAKKYLPFAAGGNNGAFIDNFTTKVAPFYGTIPSKASDKDYAFAETEFEPSPLNRPTKQGSVGADWQLNTHPVGIQYLINTTTAGAGIEGLLANNVKMFDFPTITTTVISQSVTIGTYAAGTLYVTITTDENGNKTAEIKDIEGKVVAKRVQDGPSSFTETAYAYDDLGQLRFVFQPKACETSALTGTLTPLTTASIKDFTFAYAFDSNGLMVEKKVPGSGTTTMEYDPKDRLVKTTDANNNIIQTEYDDLNRVLRTFNAGGNLTTNTYDTYPAGTLPYDAGKGFGVSNTTAVIGMVTQSTQKVIGDATLVGSLPNSTITNTIYYDAKGRTIQTVSKNHQNGTDYGSSKLDFTGRVLASKSFQNNGSTNLNIETKSTYDQGSRIKSVCQKTDDGTQYNNWQPIGRYSYNAIGEMDKKLLGCKIQTVDYKYNIRGWLTDMNDVANLSPSSTEKDFFAMQLGYAGMFNGNITAQKYITAQRKGIANDPFDIQPGETFTYAYQYDALNRLTFARLNSSTDGEIFNLTMGAYDKNGNISTLIRNLKPKNGSLTQFDNLQYTYVDNSNQLLKVTDGSGNTKFFNNGSSGIGNDYIYDANGNLTNDANKGMNISSLNYLNLPNTISKGGQTYQYAYTATGQKLSMKDGDGKKFDYIGGIVYKDTKLEFVPTAEGRWLPKGTTLSKPEGVIPDPANPSTNLPGANQLLFGRYEYNLKDHLGNLRVACRCEENPKALKPEEAYATIVTQENAYDPWGLGIETELDPNAKTGNPNDRFQYNGKEFNVGLGLSEYGARQYDATIGRWIAVDLLAEKYFDSSPYNYVLNNRSCLNF